MSSTEEIRKNKNKSNNIYLADCLIEEFNNIVKYNGNFYEFNNKIYILLTDNDLKNKLHLFIIKHLITDIWKSARIRDIISSLLYSDKIKEVSMDENKNLIAFQNGVLNINTDEFQNFSKDFYISTILNINYDKTQDKAKYFLKFLNEILNNNQTDIKNICMLGGYCLCPSFKANKLFFFDGEPASGKTTLLEIFKLFFTREQKSILTLKQLSTNNFGRLKLLTSKINISNEAKVEYLDAETIKDMTEGREIIIQKKMKDDIEIKMKAKIIIAANGLPKFNDKTKGILRRLMIFNFKNKYCSEEEIKRYNNKNNLYIEDRDLENKLKKELPAILNLFLKGLKVLKKRDYYFIIDDNNRQRLQEYNNYNDSVSEFLDMYYEYDKNSELEGNILLDEWRNWMSKTSGNQAKTNMRIQEFGKRVCSKFNIDGKRKRWMDNDDKYNDETIYPLKKRTIEKITADNIENLAKEIKF